MASSFPPAPEIGGDAYDVDRWFQQVSDYLDQFTGQEREDAELDLLYQIRRALWEANPETAPEERKRQEDDAAQRRAERRIQRAAEIEAMKDPTWIFGKD